MFGMKDYDAQNAVATEISCDADPCDIEFWEADCWT